jgi:pSer/pThr/pTyr-binding forkhead associated (FHA) protein
MSAKLVALGEGPNLTLDKPIVLIGRHAECDIQINSRKVSRRHCCVAVVKGGLLVRDLGSTNGVRINGVRMIEGKLRHGDELTIGNHSYRVSISDSIREDSSKNVKKERDSGSRSDGHSRRKNDSAKNASLESSETPIPLEPRRTPSPSPPGASSSRLPDQINLQGESASS